MEHRPEFDDIRPYYDDEVPAVIDQLVNDPDFKRVVLGYVFPGASWEELTAQMKSLNTKRDFQHQMIRDAVLNLVKKTSASCEVSGSENLDPNQPYLFITNHRDIVLDASILAVLLIQIGRESMEIGIGDNLLLQPWIERLVRLNKSYIVKRGVSFREQLLASQHLSQYIHYTILEKRESLWIAQREGRAKNSDDRTQESLLKMLAMGSEKEVGESLKELNLLPISLSYEFDPCDYLKAKEFQQKRDNPEFKKSRQDDLLNMETGLFGNKGRIHFRFGSPINPGIDKLDPGLSKNEVIASVAQLVDREIFSNYSFYPINYIFFDRLWGGDQFKDHYTELDVEAVEAYLQQQLDKVDLPDKDIPFLTEKIYEMYAYPVKNYLTTKHD